MHWTWYREKKGQDIESSGAMQKRMTNEFLIFAIDKANVRECNIPKGV